MAISTHTTERQRLRVAIHNLHWLGADHIRAWEGAATRGKAGAAMETKGKGDGKVSGSGGAEMVT